MKSECCEKVINEPKKVIESVEETLINYEGVLKG
jgi:hypothetical protein